MDDLVNASPRRCFILWPDGAVEEVAPDGDTTDSWTAGGLYDSLVLAGYPLHRDVESGRWDGVLDLAVDPSTLAVTANTALPAGEHAMGEAGQEFAAWYVANVRSRPQM